MFNDVSSEPSPRRLAAVNWRLPLQLVPCTLDENEARTWFTDYRRAGIEGLVVKAGHETLAGMLATGWAGANTAANHIAVLPHGWH